MNTIINLASQGLGAPDVALTAVRLGMGAFFACSGANKLVNAGRHAGLIETFKKDHIPAIGFMQWWVPGWEFVGGVMLAAGFFSAFAAGVLFIICAVACAAEAKARVEAFGPINEADRVADWLYIQEVVYLLLLAVTIFAGPGALAVDQVLFD